MSAIDRVKELLAAAEKRVAWSFSAEKQQRHAEWNAANDKLRDITIPLAQALVESQEALASRVALREHEASCDACWNGLECRSQAQLSDDNEKQEAAALRLDRLAKVMKQETPRS